MNLATAVCFYNNGEFDRRAFTMMGLSAKADAATAIGFFGTGFKYAITTLLRHGCTVRIVASNGYDDMLTYDFNAAPGTFKGKEQSFVYCSVSNESGDYEEQPFELPFTTHLGVNWKLWQAYRELYTNAKDEGGGVQLVNLPKDKGSCLRPGDVNVYVTGADFIKVYEEHDKYFLNQQSIVEGNRMRAVEKHFEHDNVVYYKTMYTGTKLDKPTLLTYDYTKTTELTEDRTLADTWYIRHHIGELWLANMSFDTLIEYLPKIASDTFYEYNLDTGYHSGSVDFHRACAYLVEHHKPMPMWARDTHNKSLPFDQQVDVYKPTRHQLSMYWKAIGMLHHHRMMIDADKIILCVSLPDNLLGYYRQGHIYIAKEAFSRGFEKLLGTLYEEWLHMDKECEDMSRAMQNVLVDQIAAFMVEIQELEDYAEQEALR